MSEDLKNIDELPRREIKWTPKSRSEWRGSKFVLISLFVTTVSIIFFFATREIFPTIRDEIRSRFSFITQRASEWGGSQASWVHVRLAYGSTVFNSSWSRSSSSSKDEGTLSLPQELVSEMIKSIEKELPRDGALTGWTVLPKSLQARLEKSGWFDEISIRRRFDGSLNLSLTARAPRFVARTFSGWALLDAQGLRMSRLKELSGTWTNLPTVFGWERRIEEESKFESNRIPSSDREAIKSLSELIATLSNKLFLSVLSVRISEDPLREGFTFELETTPQNTQIAATWTLTVSSASWKDRITSLQFVLSDLQAKKITSARILAQFSGRLFVEPIEEIESHGKNVSNRRRM